MTLRHAPVRVIVVRLVGDRHHACPAAHGIQNTCARDRLGYIALCSPKIHDNPGIFSHEVSHRLPTSIDLLESHSKVLQTFRRLPVNCNVKLHSIIGNGCYSLGEGVGDGVVGVENAQHPGVLSEIYVPASHTEIHRRPETI